MAEERRLEDEESEDLEARQHTDAEGKVHHNAKRYTEESDLEEGANE